MSQTKAQLVAGLNLNVSAPANALTVDSTGRVGIGTASPSTSLHVQGGASASAYATFAGNNNGADSFIIGQDTSGLTRLFQNSATPITFWTNAQERARLTSSGQWLVGTSSTTHNLRLDEKLTVVGNSSTGSTGASFVNYSNAGNHGAILDLCKSRGGSDGTMTVVQNGDNLGYLVYRGADGGNFSDSSYIVGQVDGTPSVGSIPGRIVFYTTAIGASTPTERMRITSGGRILAGTMALLAGTYLAHFSSSSGGGIWSEAGASGDACYVSRSPGDTVGMHYAGVNNAGTIVFRVNQNGDVRNTNNSYGAISDVKLKENIVDANSQWDDLKALQVRNYSFKEGQTHTQIGLVAQEVELVSPGLVSESPDFDREGNDLGTVTKSVNYSVLYMKAVKALQEAMERIEKLEAEMAAVKAQLS